MKHLKIHNFPFKNVIVLAIECKMYLEIQQKLRCFGCISKQTMRSQSWRKQGWIPRRTIFWWKASLSPQKESWAFFWTFCFHFLSFNGVFLTLKCRTLVLKHLHGDRPAAILLKMDICHQVFQIWSKWIFTSIERRVTRFNPLWVSGNIPWKRMAPDRMAFMKNYTNEKIKLKWTAAQFNNFFKYWREYKK